VCVVKLAHAFFARFLQLLERRPFEQELAAKRGKEILAGQLEGLGIITLERVARSMLLRRVRRSTAVRRCCKRQESSRVCASSGSQGGEFFAMMQK